MLRNSRNQKRLSKNEVHQILKLRNNIKRGNKKIENLVKKIKKPCIKNFKKKKSCAKVGKCLQQVKQGRYYVCAICHRGLYQRSVRFSNHEKYQILTSELCHPVKLYDEKFYTGRICYKHLYENEILYQVVPIKWL